MSILPFSKVKIKSYVIKYIKSKTKNLPYNAVFSR